MRHPNPLANLIREMDQCKSCPLHQSATRAVPGIGSYTPLMMIVGEGPGFHEDLEGEPFVGPAGEELQDILVEQGYKLQDLYVTNLVKHRAPGNRAPAAQEGITCGSKFLALETRVLAPKVIVALGRCAAEGLMRLQGIAPPRKTIRGTSFDYQGVKVFCTWHPSYIIRNGNSNVQGSKAYALRQEVIADFEAAWAYALSCLGNEQYLGV